MGGYQINYVLPRLYQSYMIMYADIYSLCFCSLFMMESWIHESQIWICDLRKVTLILSTC